MDYCKTALIKELKKEIKVRTYVPPDYTGTDYNTWAREVLLKVPPEPKPLRRVSEQY